VIVRGDFEVMDEDFEVRNRQIVGLKTKIVNFVANFYFIDCNLNILIENKCFWCEKYKKIVKNY